MTSLTSYTATTPGSANNVLGATPQNTVINVVTLFQYFFEAFGAACVWWAIVQMARDRQWPQRGIADGVRGAVRFRRNVHQHPDASPTASWPSFRLAAETSKALIGCRLDGDAPVLMHCGLRPVLSPPVAARLICEAQECSDAADYRSVCIGCAESLARGAVPS